MNQTEPVKSCDFSSPQKRKDTGEVKRILLVFSAFLWLCGESKALEIIAHRGASASKPENTLASEQLAQKMGADWLEADLVSTKDHQLILSHDVWLESTTNVAQVFPGRSRSDKHFYALDFSLAELRKLQMRPRANLDGKRAFPNRKIDVSGARITTLAELLGLKNGASGFYLEPKSPRWHRQNGVDVSKLLLAGLKASKIAPSKIWIECFDPDELKRLRFELHSPFRQTQLIAGSDVFEPDKQKFDFDAMRTPEGLRLVKRYADAIGPRLDFVISGLNGVSPLVANAHAAGLGVHPFVLQTDRFPFAPPLTENWIRAFERARIEAIFTDQPDHVRALVKSRD